MMIQNVFMTFWLILKNNYNQQNGDKINENKVSGLSLLDITKSQTVTSTCFLNPWHTENLLYPFMWIFLHIKTKHFSLDH